MPGAPKTKIVVKESPIHGQGVFAARRIDVGEIILDWSGCSDVLSDEAVNALPNGVTSDDPFGAAGQAPGVAGAEALALAQAAKGLSSLLADIAAGKSEHEILAGIRAMIAASPGQKARGKSKRLLPPRATAA